MLELISAAMIAASGITLAPKTPAQVEALRCTDGEVLYSGRKWGGKSWICALKAFAYSQHYAGSASLIARKERASMEATTIAVAREVIPLHLWATCWQESRSRFVFPNGSRIDVLGLNEPERIQGSRYGFAAVDQAEQLTLRDFELLNSCIGQGGMPWHQLLLAVNPSSPAHWIYRRYSPDLGDGVREKNGKAFARVIHVGHDDLMDIIEPAYLERLERMTGVWYKQLRLGQWCAFEGQVFGGIWDPLTMANVPAPDSWERWGGYPPPDWERVRGIDFGMDHPAVCVWMAFGPGSSRAWIYRQHYMSGLSPRENALRIAELEAREIETLRASVKDEREARSFSTHLARLNVTESWSDHDRGERATYAEEGIWSAPADKDVEAGIGTMADAMALGLLVTVRGNLVQADPRMVDLELPTCFEEEVLLYTRPRSDEDGHFKGREGVVKKDDHALDAVRYALQSRQAVRGVAVYA